MGGRTSTPCEEYFYQKCVTLEQKGLRPGFRTALKPTTWTTILSGDINDQAVILTPHLHSHQRTLQRPYNTYKFRPHAQQCFGFTCREAKGNAKRRVWNRYRPNLPQHNKHLGEVVCRTMERTQKGHIRDGGKPFVRNSLAKQLAQSNGGAVSSNNRTSEAI